MITQLSIQGLAIIDTLDIRFTPGFNVITGETGAGKSILIRALNLLSGGKATPDVIRAGFEAASVTGEFVVPREHEVVAELGERGIALEPGDSARVLLRRQIHAKGRSQAWINDVPVALTSLRVVGASLLDVFAQHENQKLLNPVDHVGYVDGFLGDPKLLKTVREAARGTNQELEALRELLERLGDGKRQSDYLSFRREELRAFAPSREDYEKIHRYCEQAEGFRKQRDPVARSVSLLEGEDGNASPAQVTREIGKLLSTLPEGGPLSSLRERVQACAREIDDIHYELGGLLASMDFDEERLEECQKRLFGYQELFRKHSVRTLEDLLEQAEQIEQALGALEGAETEIEGILARLEKNARELQRQSQKLTIAREQAASGIKEAVERELAELHMPGSVFQAEFEPVHRGIAEPEWGQMAARLVAHWEKTRTILEHVSEQGAERAQFYLSANRGEPPMPLSRVASGGELSRILLALKKALVADAETCVLVFDEIDTGISGRVADVVGRKLRELSRELQVLCISHLPQVAVYADSHFLVTKKGRGERIQSDIVPLSDEESAREIARLLSGREVTSSSLAHAKKLRQDARPGSNR